MRIHPFLSLLLVSLAVVACAKVPMSQRASRAIPHSLRPARLDFLDRPALVRVLFHPRKEEGYEAPADMRRVRIRVARDVQLAARLFVASRQAPLLLYFHGNGEIAENYDRLGEIHRKAGMSFLVVDDRGYGNSDGVPRATALMADAKAVFENLPAVLEARGLAPRQICVMGRSLGSASAIEVASHAQDRIAGLILDSAFASTKALVKTLGYRGDLSGFSEETQGFGNLSKMKRVEVRTLVLHGADDRIIPVGEARALFNACPASDKRFIESPRAGHNSIISRGGKRYFAAIHKLVLGGQD